MVNFLGVGLGLRSALRLRRNVHSVNLVLGLWSGLRLRVMACLLAYRHG